MSNHDYWAYILTNKDQTTLYIGMTNNLERRMHEHRSAVTSSFTQKYQLNRLVWYEHFRDVNAAIACEKRLKGWSRAKKVALITAFNAPWLDLSSGWPGHPIS